MKFYSTQLAYLFDDKEARRNLIALSKYIAFLIVSMILLSVGFQLIMWHVEGQDHSWISAFYWTLVTMSTLGFGDITFYTDIGRLYSMFVVGSGIVLLLIVLPFAFIRYFYAPWLEAQIHARAPRFVSSDMQNHVVICNNDPITPDLSTVWRPMVSHMCLLRPMPIRHPTTTWMAYRSFLATLTARRPSRMRVLPRPA